MSGFDFSATIRHIQVLRSYKLDFYNLSLANTYTNYELKLN